jgi:hypothetical protein
MIETKLQELTAAVTQLTTVTEALIEVLRHQSSTTTVTSGTTATTTTVEAPKPKKPKAPKVEEPAAPAPAPAPAPEPVPAAPEPVPAASPEVTLKDLRDAAQAALDAGKLNDVVAINKRFGLKRISDAPVEQYPELLAALKELTNGQA